MSKFKVITTEKLEGQTKTLVRQAAAKQNPGYRVASVGINEDGTEWEVRLDELQPDKVSSRTRQSAPPPDFLKEKDDSKDDAPDDDEDSADEADKSDAEGDSDDGDADTEGGEDAPKGDKKKDSDPVAEIERIMGELNSLLTDLGGHAQKLKEKADKVDEIHDLAAPDVEKAPPVPPVDDMASVGPTPGGGPPMPPRKPPVPTGKAPVRPVGVPTFSKRQTHVVEHPIKDDDGEYQLSDFLAAISSDPRFVDYDLQEVKKLEENNVYVASLKLKN